MKTIDNTSSLQAYQEAKLKVSKINDFLDKVEKRSNKPEVIIKDLVSSFLIPDVERKKVERDCKCQLTQTNLFFRQCNSRRDVSWRPLARRSRTPSSKQVRALTPNKASTSCRNSSLTATRRRLKRRSDWFWFQSHRLNVTATRHLPIERFDSETRTAKLSLYTFISSHCYPHMIF